MGIYARYLKKNFNRMKQNVTECNRVTYSNKVR